MPLSSWFLLLDESGAPDLLVLERGAYLDAGVEAFGVPSVDSCGGLDLDVDQALVLALAGPEDSDEEALGLDGQVIDSVSAFS